MLNTSAEPVSLGNLHAEERAAMQRLLESATFGSAPRLRSVLEYLLRTMEEGTCERVTEQSIGQDVFGRPAGYNASEDNIVRVTIRHLRSRLQEFYLAEGKGEVLVLEIPKGKYLPLFVRRDSPPVQSPLGVTAETVTLTAVITDEEHDAPHQTRAWSRTLVGLGMLSVVITAVVLGFLLRGWVNSAKAQDAGVLGGVVRPGERVEVVVADTNLQAYRQIFGRQVSLESYLSRQYTRDPLNAQDERLVRAFAFTTGSNETNVSSAIIAADIKRGLPSNDVIIKPPHDVSMREFQTDGIVVLLGGPWINPWGQMFEQRLNFQMEPAPGKLAASQIRNVKPLPGEPAEFVPQDQGNLNVNYIRVAILPNFASHGRVILLGATSPEALEAGGKFLLSPDGALNLRRELHLQGVRELPPLESVLRVEGVNSVPGSWHLVVNRLILP